MTVREILKMGDPRLLRVAQPVTDFDSDELHQLVRDLLETMAAVDGAGLAVGTDVNVDSTPKTDAQTAADASAADETQSSLAGLFFSKFPFCIPFDLAAAIKLVAAPAVAPRFEWDGIRQLDLPVTWRGSTKIVFDMGEERWQVVGEVCRWTSLVGFCIALMLVTRKVMKW